MLPVSWDGSGRNCGSLRPGLISMNESTRDVLTEIVESLCKPHPDSRRSLSPSRAPGAETSLDLAA